MERDAYMQAERWASQSAHWKVTRGVVNTEGQCETCEAQLASMDLAADAQHKLVEQFQVRTHEMNEALIKKSKSPRNTYKRDHREALEWMEANCPDVDIVIDALNLGYRVTDAKNTSAWDASRYFALTAFFESHGLRTVGIVRNHVMGDSRKNNKVTRDRLAEARNNGDLLVLPNTYDDDIFLLHAAVKSTKAYFVSNDMMRDHLWVIRKLFASKDTAAGVSRQEQSRLADSFTKWLSGRQVQVHFGSGKINAGEKVRERSMETHPVKGMPYSKWVTLFTPPMHDTRVQSNGDDGWHIPGPNNEWLCIRPNRE